MEGGIFHGIPPFVTEAEAEQAAPQRTLLILTVAKPDKAYVLPPLNGKRHHAQPSAAATKRKA